MLSIDQLRRDAKRLRRAYEARDPDAARRLANHPPKSAREAPRHADFLNVIARENGFASWPRLAWASETLGLDRAARQQRLRIAVWHGQAWRTEELLASDPDLLQDDLGLACALYRREEVLQAIANDRSAATRDVHGRQPIIHLAFSKHIHARPHLEADMLAIAEALVEAGADVNASYSYEGHPLSALYGALGHADNMVLARWLLERGANPNDGESLYHATELGHHEGLKMLIEHGAEPQGTNALLRAIDFDDVEAVRMLLDAGADPNAFDARVIGGEEPWVIPALHQCARRQASAEMVQLLLDHGADPGAAFQGTSAYAFARVHGHRDLARAIEERGGATDLTPEETALAAAAEGKDAALIDPAKLAPAYANLIREILHLPGKLPHVKRLAAIGVSTDSPDKEGLTPIQVAGWEGLPEVMGWFLRQRPDLSHVNSYGGTLLTTIIHGSENAPDRAIRDHVGCLRLALEEGVALPRQAITFAGEPEVAAFLADWAEAHPGQVIEGG